MSDHLPITIKINVCTLDKDQVRTTKSIAWHKLTIQQIADTYTKPLNETLESVVQALDEDYLKAGNVADI